MENLLLYRKRFIPNEIILLKDDKIVFADKNIIVTHWNTLKPRSDFSTGKSCFFINEGFKISQLFDKNKNLVCTYCDIIQTEFNPQNNSYIFSDLLLDVIIEPDGKIKLVDVAEVADALDEGLITQEQAKDALRKLDKLLGIIYNDEISKLTQHII